MKAWNKGESADALRIRQALDKLTGVPHIAVNLIWYSQRNKGWYVMFAMSVLRARYGAKGLRRRLGANVPHCLARIRLLGRQIFETEAK